MVVVAQLVRAPDCGSGGRGFETHLPPLIEAFAFQQRPFFFASPSTTFVAMANRRLRILFVCSWYPSTENPYLGNFIQRHAVAVSQYAEVTVIAAVESQRAELVQKGAAPLKEHLAYYVKKLPFWSYYAALKKAYRQAKAEQGDFDLVHVHVTYPAGFLALRFKRPYVLTEHFTGFLHSSDFRWNPWQKRIALAVLRNTSLALPVSENLGHGLQSFAGKVKWTKVSNVVDAQNFYPAESLPATFTFLHISTLNEETKNISGLLRAFKKLNEKGLDFELHIGGDGDLEQLHNRLKNSGIDRQKVKTFGAQPSAKIAERMRKAHVFVLASHIENQPCVILEALCCGLPIVSTRVGGIHEEINPENGILVEPGKTDALAEALEKIMQNYGQYQKESIAQKARATYSYEAVGEKLNDIYLSVLNEDALNR